MKWTMSVRGLNRSPARVGRWRSLACKSDRVDGIGPDPRAPRSKGQAVGSSDTPWVWDGCSTGVCL